MRKLVLLVCVFAFSLSGAICPTPKAGVIPSWESTTGRFGFYPITNEISLYKNVDDAGKDRGQTVQIISINSLKLLTEFSFEFTGDFNFDFAQGFDDDHYMELSIVKHISPFFSLNVQRVMSTFEPEPVNQFGVRLSF